MLRRGLAGPALPRPGDARATGGATPDGPLAAALIGVALRPQQREYRLVLWPLNEVATLRCLRRPQAARAPWPAGSGPPGCWRTTTTTYQSS